MLLVLWLEVGLGRWMTSPVVLTFEFWHSGTLCSYSDPHLPASSPLWSPDCAWLCLFFPPSKNTSFSLPPLKQLPAYEVEKMTLHLMMNGPWPLEPVPAGLTWSRIYISQEISRTRLCTSGRNDCRPAALRCRKWRLNICWSTSAVNWTTFTAAVFPLSSGFLVWHTSAVVGLPRWEPFCYMINYSEQQLWRD